MIESEDLISQVQPILSICIQTFNRCGYLYFALKSITEQEIFKYTFDVEVIILDNGSSDFTEQIAKIFVDQFPDKIKYYKNETYIPDESFEKIFSYATGKILKSYDDNFVLVDGALKLCIEKIEEFRDEKPIIFFANKHSRAERSSMCTNLNEFVEVASYLSTWADAFSIWKEDFDKLKDFFSSTSSKFKQTDILFKLIAEGRKIFIWDEEIFEEREVIEKGGYNIAKIFGENYLSLLKQYSQNKVFRKALNKKIYEKEKKILLLNYIIPMAFSELLTEKTVEPEYEGYWRHLIKYYWYNLYFYTSVVQIFRLLIEAEFKSFGRKLNPNYYQHCWRKRNKHNETTISKDVDVNKIFVGKGTRGNIDVKFSDYREELLIIEDEVTIEDEVKFVLGTKELIIVKDGTIVKKGSVITR